MEKRKEDQILLCAIHKALDCKSAYAKLTLTNEGEAHECRKPSMSGFRSMYCV